MAPSESLVKATPKVQRSSTKPIATKGRSSPTTAMKKIKADKKAIEKIPLKLNNTTVETRQRSSTVPIVSTPKPKENKTIPLPGSVTKSAKKQLWKRRPKPAHSGVPVPEKMKQLILKRLQNLDDNF